MAPSTSERDESFTRFVTGASPGLMRTAWLLTGSDDTARELVQATLVKAYVHWPRIRSDSALAYCRRILVNERTDRLRRLGRELPVAEPEFVPTGGTGADEGTGLVDERDDIVRLLKRLPEQQRRIVVLRYYCDLSEDAVADTLGISVGTVKSSASRALAALRTHLVVAEGGIR